MSSAELPKLARLAAGRLEMDSITSDSDISMSSESSSDDISEITFDEFK